MLGGDYQYDPIGSVGVPMIISQNGALLPVHKTIFGAVGFHRELKIQEIDASL